MSASPPNDMEKYGTSSTDSKAVQSSLYQYRVLRICIVGRAYSKISCFGYGNLLGTGTGGQAGCVAMDHLYHSNKPSSKTMALWTIVPY
jgi:hypothetical protein